MPRKTQLIASAVATGALTLAALSPLASGAAAAPGDGDPGCPAAFPAGDLTEGMPATGLTTAGYYPGGPATPSKRAPEQFDGTYIGTLEDPAGDLFLFDLSGSRITKADGSIDAGIWAGISGSPLHATDGRLIGSVSYAFTQVTGTTIAGVTPASDLYALLGETAPAPPARIQLDKGERAMLRSAGAPARVASSNLVKLTAPRLMGGMAGMPVKTLRALARKAGVDAPQLAGGTGTQDEEIPVVAGGNVAVANSYGSVALFSVGTASAVCDDVVIGYGHSNEWAPLGATIHGAETVTIMADGPASYKMANLGAPVGTLLHDRLNGITGRIGALPDAAIVEVTTSGPRGSITESVVNEPAALSHVISSQVYRDAALSLDEAAAGGAEVSWDITFTRGDGSSETFSRSQVYASDLSIADEVVSGVAGDVDTIQANGFEDVTITEVAVRQEVSRTYRAYAFGRAQVKIGGSWKKLQDGGKVKVKPGKKLKVRLQLKRAGSKAQVAPTQKTFIFSVPKNAVGSGLFSITGNGASFWDFDDMFFDFEEETGDVTEPTSFDGLLKTLAASPRQDTVTATLDIINAKGKAKTSAQQWSPGAVTFGSHTAEVKAPKPKKPGKNKPGKKKQR